MARTVSVTGISVTLTGFSVAQTVGAACAFRPPSRFFASICMVEAVHVNGHKTHVLRIVCKNLAYDYCERPKVAVYLIAACGKSSTDGAVQDLAKVGRNCSVNAEN